MDLNNSDLGILVALSNNGGQDNLPLGEAKVIAVAWRAYRAC